MLTSRTEDGQFDSLQAYEHAYSTSECDTPVSTEALLHASGHAGRQTMVGGSQAGVSTHLDDGYWGAGEVAAVGLVHATVVHGAVRGIVLGAGALKQLQQRRRALPHCADTTHPCTMRICKEPHMQLLHTTHICSTALHMCNFQRAVTARGSSTCGK